MRLLINCASSSLCSGNKGIFGSGICTGLLCNGICTWLILRGSMSLLINCECSFLCNGIIWVVGSDICSSSAMKSAHEWFFCFSCLAKCNLKGYIYVYGWTFICFSHIAFTANFACVGIQIWLSIYNYLPTAKQFYLLVLITRGAWYQWHNACRILVNKLSELRHIIFICNFIILSLSI